MILVLGDISTLTTALSGWEGDKREEMRDRGGGRGKEMRDRGRKGER